MPFAGKTLQTVLALYGFGEKPARRRPDPIELKTAPPFKASVDARH